MSEALRAFPNLWGMLPSLWILISSSSQESSEIFFGFIWSIIFLAWKCGCTGGRKMLGGTWAWVTWGKCEHPCVTSPAGLKVCLSDFSTSCFPLIFTITATHICAVQVMQMQTFVCNLLYSSWGVITALNGKHGIDALPSWVRQLCLFPAVEMAGTVKKMC